MSILSFPRINFRGVFRTNPCTCNNDDVMPHVVERDTDTFGGDLGAKTDDEIHAYLRERVSMVNENINGCTTFLRSGWNLYGDHTTTFKDTVITSVVSGTGAAERSATAAEDPIVGQPVRLLGSVSVDPQRRGTPMLCDLDPTGLVTTQLWIGGLQIGSGGGSGIDPAQMLQFNHDTRAFQDWLHFFATLGDYGGEQNFVGIGCMMQFAIPKSAIPSTVPFNSPGLKSLLSAARAAAGLVVRFRIFEVEPGLTDETLYRAFQQGNAIENPAFGYLIGTIGVWNPGEPEHEPAGRKLICPFPRPAMAYRDPQGKVETWPPQPTPWTPKLPPTLIGNVVAHVDASRSIISLDLADTFPKYGFRNPNGPERPGARGFGAPKVKADFGLVELAVLPADGSPAVSIVSIDYGLADYSSYEDFGGIIDVPYKPTQKNLIATGTLLLRGAPESKLNPGAQLLKEQTIRVVTDDRAAYWMPNTKNPVRVKVYERGGPTKGPTTLYLHEYFNFIDTSQKSTQCVDGMRPNQTVVQDTQGMLDFPAEVTIPAGFPDWYPIPVTTPRSGATILAYQLDPTPFGTGNDKNITGVPVWSFADYSSIRVFADYVVMPPPPLEGGEIPWEFVYENVLRFYYLVYPAMSRFIPLNAPDALAQAARLIEQRLNTPDQPGFWTTYNMPVTRTMPPAKVKLLLKFIAQHAAARAARS